MSPTKILFLELAEELHQLQSPARFRHSLTVADLAAQLARRHGWSSEEAKLAGLLHDLAKEWKPTELIRYVKKHKLAVPDLKFIVKINPNLLHGYVSAHVAGKNGWIKNKKSLKAIASHTLGHKKMSREDKILYIADLAAPDRKFKEADSIRATAMEDLSAGFREALALKISYQIRKNKPVHPLPIQIWNELVSGRKK